MSSSAGERKGYEAFGSFHTPPPAALFTSDNAMPDLPDPSTFLPDAQLEDRLLFPKGKSDVDALAVIQSNQKHFTIDLTRWTYLNHGAFGGPTRFGMRVANAWREFAEQQPLLFNDRFLFPYVVQSIKALAKELRLKDAEELVLLPNATAGLHAVLSSVLQQTTAEDPVVVCFSTRYGAVRKMLQDAENQLMGLHVHEEPLTLEESYDDDAVLRRLETALAQYDKTKIALVVVDHITSNTGVVLPVERIVQTCRAHDVPVLVDGAHGLFNLDLDLSTINADYYVGNCHKWFASPKGAAFLHVNKHHGVAATRKAEIAPRVISHGFFDGYQSAFMWQGLQDYSPWLALPKCIEYWHHQDISRCRSYMHLLIQEATELLYMSWRMADALEQAKTFPAHKRHAMRLVRLPSTTIFGVPTNCTTQANTSADAKHIQDTLHHVHRIEVPVKCIEGQLYARISGHVYNHLGQYERLAQAIQPAQ
ncbi:hypothetical protein Poli38472_009460 [Pythium oligandrum]|uniref:Aminotransferase class V domain-containing protein n=1 Tax=Pythium oligandrum TaxID=41045 RepID=A0A8K1FJM5_PYTOL|nr:hypothetical protein Poli38472_009460 [Pythium oligandrum]|eukprot:TMW61967.1 hypothetical protein Poli38472_009460 [Pythium oligandrum]